MSKKLMDYTLEELWQLFPIYLTEHNTQWEKQYEEEKARLWEYFSQIEPVEVHHIGSTVIEGIWAKPIVDILIEIPLERDIATYGGILISQGYLLMSKEERRVSLNKGYTESGFDKEVFHIHLRYVGDRDEIYFRDYLKKHKEVALEYEKLKLSLWKQYEHNRDGYTEAKGEFIKKYTLLEKQEIRK